MAILSIVMGVFVFGVGITSGLVIGYLLFIFFHPSAVKVRSLAEQKAQRLQKPDHDCMDWLNKFIETMWPYLNQAICQTAKSIAEPIIAEQIPKYRIDSVELQELTFQGIKVFTTEEKEFIIEPVLMWAGNPNITVAAKAFGLKATAKVMDLQVFASPRITLKPLVPTFPCFANIFFSLMEKPRVSFQLKFLGAIMMFNMFIPGIKRIVQELINDQVANTCLYPKELPVQVMDPTKL